MNGIGKRGTAAILMYHSISEDAERGVHPYFRLCTAPNVFASHIQFLKQAGYTVLSVDEISDSIEFKRPLPPRTAAITFDDGYRDFLTDAVPILKQHDFTATVYLPTAYIGAQPLRFKGKDCLTWAEVRELHAEGVRFGSHTVTHPQLWEATDEAAADEVRRSKEIIEEKLGAPVTSFSYPYAFPEHDSEFKKRMRELLHQSGYRHGVSTIIGRADHRSDQFFLRRLPVNSLDDLALFRAKLEGAYDWIHWLQYLNKLAKSKIA
jgi:peptidoglycan/xylan/chitin deacetylase (PgdA/CDA1 family)